MSELPTLALDKQARSNISRALGCIPQGIFLLTAMCERRTRGVMVSWVQQAGFEPPMVLVALRKGLDIVPLIHDSHHFALSQLASDDKLTVKKFGATLTGDPLQRGDDLFQGMDTFRGPTGTPILSKALSYFDCELVRHIDVDSDHDLYVGLVLEGGVPHPGQVTIHLRDNGFKY